MKNKRFVSFLLLVVAMLFVGCGNAAISRGDDTKGADRALFLPPAIPSAVAGVENRRAYLAAHYWDTFDFESSKLLANDSLMGVAVGGYIQVLLMNPPKVVEQSVDVVLDRALEVGYDPFERLTSTLEDYLYDPNSPMRNEELYIYVLRYTVDSAALEDIYKLRSRKQLDMVIKNRRGSIAADFSYESLDGDVSTLHAIESPLTILFFNTPDCEDCARVKSYIEESSHLNQMVLARRLTILGIYPESDMALWRKAKYPSTILNGADVRGVISKHRLYDLKALPTLYLLDSDKRVILKDSTIEGIEQFMQYNNR